MNGDEFLKHRDEFKLSLEKKERKIIEKMSKIFKGREDVQEGMEDDGSLSQIDASTKVLVRVWDSIPEDRTQPRREVLIKVLTGHNIIRILGNASRYSLTNQLHDNFLTEKIIQLGMELADIEFAGEFCKRYMAGDPTLQDWLNSDVF